MRLLRQETRKILLVGSGPCGEQLVHADCDVVNTDTGAAAVTYAKYGTFSAVVLMATGRNVEFAETALTLKDVQPFLEIIIVMDKTPEKETTAEVAAVLRAIPRARILTTPELNNYLTSPESR